MVGQFREELEYFSRTGWRGAPNVRLLFWYERYWWIGMRLSSNQALVLGGPPFPDVEFSDWPTLLAFTSNHAHAPNPSRAPGPFSCGHVPRRCGSCFTVETSSIKVRSPSLAPYAPGRLALSGFGRAAL
jgi:hypothetical protein